MHFNGDAVLLSHGITDNREGVAGYGKLFLEHGYAVLLPDSRAHVQLWLVPHAWHTGAWIAAPDEFESRVLGWFSGHRQNESQKLRAKSQ